MHAISDQRFRKEFESPRGGKFVIQTDKFGLFYIQMENGGVRPEICNQKFTNYRLAAGALKDYFDEKPPVVPRETKKKAD